MGILACAEGEKPIHMGEHQCPQGSRCIFVLGAVSKPGNGLRFHVPGKFVPISGNLAKIAIFGNRSDFPKLLMEPGGIRCANCLVLKRLENVQIGVQFSSWHTPKPKSALGFGLWISVWDFLNFGFCNPDNANAGRRI